MIIYSSHIEQLNYLPYHIVFNNQTILHKKDIITFLFNGDEEVYNKFYSSLPTEIMNNEEIVNFITFLDYSIDAHFEAYHKARQDKDSKAYYQLFRPIVLLLARIGAKKIGNSFEAGETPIQIFERELQKR